MGFLHTARRTASVSLFALVASTPGVSADPAPPFADDAVAATCGLDGHRRYATTWSPVIQIPDNDPDGVSSPPLRIPHDGSVLWDVAIEPTLFFDRYYSQLILTAAYDLQCDGIPEASVDLLYRACLENGHTTLYCTRSYVFTDRELTGVRCLNPEPAGCFLPTTYSEGSRQLRNAFNGLPAGGCFTLKASDNVRYYTGYLCGLAVYTSGTPPVPAIAPSWGALKVFYR